MERWTKQQRRIMDLVLKGAGCGWYDIDQLISLLGAACSKQATQCSLRILEARGMVLRSYETRRGRRRMVLEATLDAFNTFRSASGSGA